MEACKTVQAYNVLEHTETSTLVDSKHPPVNNNTRNADDTDPDEWIPPNFSIWSPVRPLSEEEEKEIADMIAQVQAPPIFGQRLSFHPEWVSNQLAEPDIDEWIPPNFSIWSTNDNALSSEEEQDIERMLTGVQAPPSFGAPL